MNERRLGLRVGSICPSAPASAATFRQIGGTCKGEQTGALAALKEGGNPTLDMVLKAVKALGAQLKANRAA